MGRRGPLPKNPATLHGHRKRTAPATRATPAAPAALDVIEPRAEWLDETKQAWSTYWRSDMAAIALDVDVPAVTRLFSLYDQYSRAMEVASKAIVVRGSMGQIRSNPLADHALKLDSAIVRLENELGLTPAGRLRMGINVRRPGQATPSAEPSVSPYAHLRVVGE